MRVNAARRRQKIARAVEPAAVVLPLRTETNSPPLLSNMGPALIRWWRKIGDSTGAARICDSRFVGLVFVCCGRMFSHEDETRSDVVTPDDARPGARSYFWKSARRCDAARIWRLRMSLLRRSPRRDHATGGTSRRSVLLCLPALPADQQTCERGFGGACGGGGCGQK